MYLLASTYHHFSCSFFVFFKNLTYVCIFIFLQKVDNCTPLEEEDLVDSVLGSLISKDETIMGRLFLEANIQDQTCQTLLRKWDHLKPSTQKVLSLVSRANKFEKEKECIILNLAKAEQEVIINHISRQTKIGKSYKRKI